MSELKRCLAMAATCRQRAIDDPEQRAAWLAQAEMWNQLAGSSLLRKSDAPQRVAHEMIDERDDRRRRELSS